MVYNHNVHRSDDYFFMMEECCEIGHLKTWQLRTSGSFVLIRVGKLLLRRRHFWNFFLNDFNLMEVLILVSFRKLFLK